MCYSVTEKGLAVEDVVFLALGGDGARIQVCGEVVVTDRVVEDGCRADGVDECGPHLIFQRIDSVVFVNETAAVVECIFRQDGFQHQQFDILP